MADTLLGLRVLMGGKRVPMAAPLLCTLKNLERAGAELSLLPPVTEHRSQDLYQHPIVSYMTLERIGRQSTEMTKNLQEPSVLPALVFLTQLFCKEAWKLVPAHHVPESSASVSEMRSINLFTHISYNKSFSSESKISGIYNSKHSQRSEAILQHLFLEMHFKCEEQMKNFSLTLITILHQ